MKRIILSLIPVLMFGMLFSCKKKDNAPADSASVLFVNGCAGTLPAIDAKVDDINVSGALNLPFTSNSGYKYIKAGASVNIAYYITNVGTPVINRSFNVVSGAHYSAFAGGLITNPSLVFTEDDMTAPASNSARIRFINLSPDAMSVTATASNTVIGADVTSMSVTSPINLTAGSFELKAGDPTNINTVVTAGSNTLAAGKIYTLMLTGSLAGTGVSALKLTLISNN
jgi:hypothetical protein